MCNQINIDMKQKETQTPKTAHCPERAMGKQDLQKKLCDLRRKRDRMAKELPWVCYLIELMERDLGDP